MAGKTTEREKTTRRGFFSTLGLGAGAMGALAIGARDAEATTAGKRPDGSLGYRETDHVKRVYETMRF
jgi:hypothetical protein